MTQSCPVTTDRSSSTAEPSRLSCCLVSRCARSGTGVGFRSGFAGGQGEELVGQGLNPALRGGGVNPALGCGQAHDAALGHRWVIDRALKRGGRSVVFLGDLGAVTDLGYQFLLRVEVVGQLGLKLPDLVE